MLIVRNRITLINMQSMYEITVVILPQRTHLIGNKESVCLLVLFWCARFGFFHTRRAYWEIFFALFISVSMFYECDKIHYTQMHSNMRKAYSIIFTEYKR
jgi:hypothetical protein